MRLWFPVSVPLRIAQKISVRLVCGSRCVTGHLPASPTSGFALATNSSSNPARSRQAWKVSAFFPVASFVLWQAITKALGDKASIRRYGFFYVPMDEALVRSVVDLSGRPFLAYNSPSDVPAIGAAFSFQLVEEFLRAISVNAGMNLHVDVLAGRDAHHMAEGIFKSLSRALDEATRIDPRVQGIPSTKGVL